MKKSSTISTVFKIGFFALFLLVCCHGRTRYSGADQEKMAIQFFSAKINGVLWEGYPSEEAEGYQVTYKPLSRQLQISAGAKDSSRIELSFHAIDRIVPGSYPSTKNDHGIESGIFYYPAAKNKDMGSITAEVPIQENTVVLTKVEFISKDTYLLEGTFSGTLYGLSPIHLAPASQLTAGKFRVIYRAGLNNPSL
ncbi:hypothetical protein [Pedobacter nutrimenti]|uniref:hypothetical protein n=1 Tax=Pedobacter nutrimenti TaxID=1241337 RepID=UPI00292EE9B9|nr:hypothetical protein [Pedobacter nutrimenti]